jgi:hypothetical protein
MFLGTTVDNTADRDAKGRGHSLKGEAIGSAKLTEADVRAIRAAVGPQRAIATQFNVSQAAVSNIRIGKAWAHLL